MPWSNQKDSGGPSGGGQNDQKHANDFKLKGSGGNGYGGGFGNDSQPDMDKIFRKSKDQLRQFGGGGIIAMVALFVFGFWLFQCFYVVQQNEEAIELRFGKPKNTIISEGLHFHFWPIDTYRKVSRTEQTATIGRRDQDVQMLSGDQNIVNVNFSVYYYISNPAAYLFHVDDQKGTIQQVAESAMREIVGRRPADDIYRDQREAVAREVLAIIQSTLDKYDLGVKVTRVSITEAAPPAEVAAAFNSVQQAEQERNRAIEQGNQERAQKRGRANGEAARIREAAAGYKTRIVEEARGEADRFTSVAQEVKLAPKATRFRLYVEMMEQMLATPGKVILEKTGNILPYLPLQDLIRQPSSTIEGNTIQGKMNSHSMSSNRPWSTSTSGGLPFSSDRER